jgi:hypothetical protein
MTLEELLDFCDREFWEVKSQRDNFIDLSYERSYADFIYDEATVWPKEEIVDVMYNEITWGNTEIQTYRFTYEEFVKWHNSTYNNF